MQQLGDYKLIEKIGAGGMGEVWRGENVHTHLACAVKLLPMAATQDGNFVARFFDEGRVMQTLKHPNIVPVHHVGHDKESGRYYFVMDFVAGADGESQSLHDLLQASADNRLPEADVRKWAAQIAEGLAYAHKQGIVHRDIKPANILIDADNNAQIADFGLAKAVGDEYIQTQIHQSIQHSMSGSLGDQPTILNAGAERKRSSESRPIEGTLDGLDTIQPGQSSHSTAESILGTYDYMSPEQRNELPGVPVAPPSDIYAYGVMIYRLLMGKRPVGMADVPSTRGLSEAWDPVVLRCLKHQPQDRYADGSALARGLALPMPSKRVPPKLPSPPAARKYRWIGIAVALILLLSVGGWALFIGPGSESPSGEVSAKQSAKKPVPVARKGPLLKMGIHTSPGPSPSPITKTQVVTLRPRDSKATIYYTLNAGFPDRSSAVYKLPLTIPPGTDIRCLTVLEGHLDRNELFSYPAAVLPPPKLRWYDGGRVTGRVRVQVPTTMLPKGVSWYYTLDGSTPTKDSPILRKEFYLTRPGILSVRAIGGEVPSGPVERMVFPIVAMTMEKVLLTQAQAKRAKEKLETIPDTPRFGVLSKSLNDAWTAGERQLARDERNEAAKKYREVLGISDEIGDLVALRTKAMEKYADFGSRLTAADPTLVSVAKSDFDKLGQSHEELMTMLTDEKYAQVISGVSSLRRRYASWVRMVDTIRQGQRDWPVVQQALSGFSQSKQDELNDAYAAAERFMKEKNDRQAAVMYGRISDVFEACVRTFSGHKGPVYAAQISPDGKHALSGGHDRTLKYWDVQTGQCLRTLEGHRKSVISISISSDGKFALSASSDRTVKHWDLQTGKCLRTLVFTVGGSVDSVAISPDGKHGLLGGHRVTYWDLQTKKRLRTFKGHKDVVRSVSISRDGKYGLSASKDKTIKYWDLETGKCLRTLKGHRSGMRSVAISADGRFAFSASTGYTVRYWDLQTGKCLRTLGTGGWNRAYSIAMSPDGKYGVAGFKDKTVKLWDLQAGKRLRTLEGHKGAVYSLSVSPDGRHVLSGGDDWKMKLWCPSEPREEAE